MKYEIEVEDNFINETAPGYKVVRLGCPKIGEFVITRKQGVIQVSDDIVMASRCMVIVEKVKPKRRIFELVRENSYGKIGEFFASGNNLNRIACDTAYRYDIYKEIKDGEN